MKRLARYALAQPALQHYAGVGHQALGALAQVLRGALGVIADLAPGLVHLIAHLRAPALAGNGVEEIHGERSDSQRSQHANDHGKPPVGN